MGCCSFCISKSWKENESICHQQTPMRDSVTLRATLKLLVPMISWLHLTSVLHKQGFTSLMLYCTIYMMWLISAFKLSYDELYLTRSGIYTVLCRALSIGHSEDLIGRNSCWSHTWLDPMWLTAWMSSWQQQRTSGMSIYVHLSMNWITCGWNIYGLLLVLSAGHFLFLI